MIVKKIYYKTKDLIEDDFNVRFWERFGIVVLLLSLIFSIGVVGGFILHNYEEPVIGMFILIIFLVLIMSNSMVAFKGGGLNIIIVTITGMITLIISLFCGITGMIISENVMWYHPNIWWLWLLLVVIVWILAELEIIFFVEKKKNPSNIYIWTTKGLAILDAIITVIIIDVLITVYKPIIRYLELVNWTITIKIITLTIGFIAIGLIAISIMILLVYGLHRLNKKILTKKKQKTKK